MNNAPSLSFRRSTLASFATHAALFATLGTAPAGAGELCEQQPKLTASDGAGPHQFGYSVAISGHTAIVGANQDNDNGFGSGSAYVFVADEKGWTQQQKLVPADGAFSEEFGNAVAISGDTTIVGAFHDDQAGPNSGSAYVFVRSGAVWTQQQKLTAPDGAAFDVFGLTVAISGDTAIIGAFGNASPALGKGFAYVFVRSGSVWTHQQKLAAPDGVPSDLFGFSSVSIDGDTVIIGARQDDDLGSNSGSAHVFVRSGPPGRQVWTHQQKLLAADGAAEDEFGSSISIDGNTVVVGAHRDDDLGSSTGSAYVFVRAGTRWTQQQKLAASDASTNDWFGFSVSISGDKAIVGAVFDDDMASNSGAAYIFARFGTVWTQEQKFSAPDGASDDWFGRSVSISGGAAIAGVSNDDDLGSNSGSAYIFACGGPAILGDINGDGAVSGADLAVLLGAWGTADPLADLNDDGTVDAADLALLLGAWTG